MKKFLNDIFISFSEAKERWKKETPNFFKKLKKIALILGGSAIAAYSINMTMGLGLDLDFLSYVIVICASVAGTSQLTKVD